MTLAVSSDTAATVRSIRMRMVGSWALAFGGGALWLAVAGMSWIRPWMGQLVIFPFAFAAFKLRARAPALPLFTRPPVRPWASVFLWCFLGAAALIFCSAFFLSPEQHRYVYVSLFAAFVVWGIIFELCLFISPLRFVENSQSQPHA